MLFTGEGVRRLVDVAKSLGMESQVIDALRSTWTATRGPKPARALRELGVLPTVPTEHPTTDGIIEALQSRDWKDARVGVQLCGDSPNERVSHFPRQSGRTSDDRGSLRLRPGDRRRQDRPARPLHGVGHHRCRGVHVQRASGPLVSAARSRGIDDTLRRGLRRTRIAALGPVVATELRDRGCSVDIIPPRSFYMRSLLNEIVSSLGKRPLNTPRRTA